MVYLTTDPGVVVAESAVVVMVRPGTSTVTTAVQAAGAGPDAGQVLPGVVEVSVSASVLLPVSGLSTVTVKRMTADWPWSRSPSQVRSWPSNEIRPSVVVASPL